MHFWLTLIIFWHKNPLKRLKNVPSKTHLDTLVLYFPLSIKDIKTEVESEEQLPYRADVFAQAGIQSESRSNRRRLLS